MRMEISFPALIRKTSATLFTAAAMSLVSATPLPATTLIFTIPVAEQPETGDSSLYEDCDRAAIASEIGGAASAHKGATRLAVRESELRRTDRCLTAVPGVAEYYRETSDPAPALSLAADASASQNPAIDPLDLLFVEDQLPIEKRATTTDPNFAYDALPGSDASREICHAPDLLELAGPEGYDLYAFDSQALDTDLSQQEADEAAAGAVDNAAVDLYDEWYGDDYDLYLEEIEATQLTVEKQSTEQSRLDFGDLIDLQADRESAEERFIEENQDYFDEYGTLGYGQFEDAAKNAPSERDSTSLEYDYECDYDCFPANLTNEDSLVAPLIARSSRALHDSAQAVSELTVVGCSHVELGCEYLTQMVYFGQVDNARPKVAARAEFVTRSGDALAVTQPGYFANLVPAAEPKLPMLDKREQVATNGTRLLLDRIALTARQAVTKWSDRVEVANHFVRNTFQGAVELSERSTDQIRHNQPRSAERNGPQLEELLEF